MKSSRLVPGLLLAWIPIVFFVAPILIGIFRSISMNKATGLGAVAVGLSEGLATSGLIAILACEVYAVVLLVKTFSGGDLLTRLVAILSIGGGVVFVILLCGAIAWMRSNAMG